MTLASKTRVRRGAAAGLDLPPPFRAIALREVGDAFAHATAVAAREGAGTLVYVGRFDVAEFAVVLEPDEPLRSARRTIYAGMVALADTLGAFAPPEKPIAIHWPDAIVVDGGLVGGGCLGWPSDADDDAPPPWLVFAAMIRTAMIGEHEPGVRPLATALAEEGFFDLNSGRLIESFARHFMVAIDAWQQDRFAEVAKIYLSRLLPEQGARGHIDDNGDLLVRRAGVVVERRALLPTLAAPSWLDPATGAPRR
jgi:biotin-(acetyl-CoA carboxylase) ligase